MKVDMQANGTLYVKAEGGLESFALSEWGHRVDWNKAVEAGVVLIVETDAPGKSAYVNVDPIRDRLARAERALTRAGYTYLEGAAEWKPPIGGRKDGHVYITHTEPNGLMWGGYTRDVDGKRVATTGDGTSIVVTHDRDGLGVHVMSPRRKESVSDHTHP